MRKRTTKAQGWPGRTVALLGRIVPRLFQPASASGALAAVLDLSRSKAELVTENALLRQQLAVLQRQAKHLRLHHTLSHAGLIGAELPRPGEVTRAHVV